jgi:Fic family protein
MKKCLDSFMPLKEYHQREVQEYFDTFYTYESNKIEGNTLTHQETSFVISEGAIIKGKSLLEHQEAKNHFHGVQLVREMVEEGMSLNLEIIKKIHFVILTGINNEYAGKWREEEVFIKGSDFVFPSASMLENLMFGLEHFYSQNKNSMHPVELAANVHEKFVTIHPFVDGNGRTARLLMNFILLGHGYPLTIISGEIEERNEYYKTLESSRIEGMNNSDFQVFIAKKVKSSLKRYLEICIESKTLGDGQYFFDLLKRNTGV